MLLGQNVNAYHGRGPDGNAWSLARAARNDCQKSMVSSGSDYTTSHPRDMADDLIEAHRDLPKLMPYLHLPVQAGSTACLHAMNRGHDRGFYLRLVEKLRAARPDLALSGDFIVGFPGETEDGFRRDALARRRGRIRERLFVQIFAAPRNAGGGDGAGAGGREVGAAHSACRRFSRSSRRRSTRACAG